MVSRRQVLAAAGTGVGLGVAGVGIGRAIHRGVVWEKWIRGRREGESSDLHSVVVDGDGEPYVVERLEDVDVFDRADEREPVVSGETHDRLREQYAGVEYGLVVCTKDGRRGCEGGPVDRNAFNSVQVGDDVTSVTFRGEFHTL